MSIKIDVGIPIPMKTTKNNPKYDEVRRIIDKLEIGDSFIVPQEFIHKVKLKNGTEVTAVRPNLSQMFKRRGKAGSSRVIDSESNTYRMWRIE